MASGEWHCQNRTFLKIESHEKDNENVPETGCLSIIVLGATGDLAKKKTFPALFNLYRQVSGLLVLVYVFSIICLRFCDL